MADADTSRGHQRVGMACTYCRRRKIRCDGDHKCQNCIRTKQVCIYAAVDARDQTTLKETRRAVFPQQRGSSSTGGGRGGATRGVGASKRKGAGGRKRRASKDSDDDDDFYAGEPIREVALGRVIVVVGTSSSRGRTQTEQSSSGHSSTSSPTPLTPRSASEADWDRSPHHPHSNLHPHPKTHYTHPPITQTANYSNSSSPSSVASSSNPALSARSSPNVGPGGALPAWVPAWTPTATSPYFPSVLLGSGYTYDDAVRLDRDQRTVLPGASPSNSPHQALHPLPTSQQQQNRQEQHQRIQGSGSSSSPSSGPGGQSALGFFTNNNNQNEGRRNQVVGHQVPLYPLPTSSSSSSSNLNQSSLLAPSAITPDLYQAPLPESEYDVAFDYSRLNAYPSSFMIAANSNSFNHHRSNSSHSTTSNVSDSHSQHSSYDAVGGNFHLPPRSYSSSIPRRSSQLSNNDSSSSHQHSQRHRAQTDGVMPYNSSLFADHQALFEGLSGLEGGYDASTSPDGGSSFALDLSIEGVGGGEHGLGRGSFSEAGIAGWNGGGFGF